MMYSLTDDQLWVLTSLVADELYALPRPFAGSGRFREARLSAALEFIEQVDAVTTDDSIKRNIRRARKGMEPR
jgi:hypothetical protein